MKTKSKKRNAPKNGHPALEALHEIGLSLAQFDAIHNINDKKLTRACDKAIALLQVQLNRMSKPGFNPAGFGSGALVETRRAKERLAHGKTAPGKRLPPTGGKRSDNTAAAKVARIVGVSPRNMERRSARTSSREGK